MSGFRNRTVVLSLLTTALALQPEPLRAQRVAVLDATRSGPFNVFDGSDVSAMREATLSIVDEIVPLGTLLELDVTTHDMVLLHNGFGFHAPLQPALSADEQQKLRAFVEEGGAAWLLIDSYSGSAVRAASSLLAPFDVTLAGLTDDVEVAIEDPDGHPLTRGQDRFTLDLPTWLADLGPCATPVVSLEPPGGPVLAVIEAGALAPGSGRVVLGSEASWIVDPVGLFEEHKVLFENSLNWLIGDIESGAPAGACDPDWTPPVSEGTFGECRVLGPAVNAPRYSHGASLTRDGLCLVFEAERPGLGQGGTDLYLATRATVNAEFGPAEPLAELNGPLHETEPNIGPDGLTLYFSHTDVDRTNPGDSGEIFVATRSSRDDPFGEPLPLALPELPGGAAEAAPAEDGLSLIIEVRISGDRDLYEVTRPSVDAPFEELRPLSELNTAGGFEGDPCISADGLTLLFARNQRALWWATRPAPRDADGAPVPFGTPRWVPGCVQGDGSGTLHQWEYGPFITPDWPAAGSKLYFTRYSCSAASAGDCGGDALWEANWEPAAAIPPVVFRRGDCNDDGAIDIADISCTLNWLFLGADAPGCAAVTDNNGDGGTDISDGTYLLNHLFLGGSAPTAPYPGCGPGTLPTDDESCGTVPVHCGE